MFKTLTIASAVSLSMASAALPATSLFTDRASFDAATGALVDHTSGVIPRGTVSAAYSEGLTVTTLSAEMASVSSFGFTDPSGLLDPIIMNDEDIDFTFSSERFAFGLSIFEPTSPYVSRAAPGCGTPACVDSRFTFSFFSGTTLVGTVDFNVPDDTKAFLGVSSSLGFDSVQMRETAGTNDDEYFGEFVSSASLAPVPVPLPFVLLGGGVLALGALKRRKG